MSALALLVVLAGALGLLVGSFLNVVVHRVPAGRSVVSPPSACGSCGHAIRRRDNVPVLSWLLLRGRCRDCGARVSARYPLVESGTALAFALVAAVLLPAALAATDAPLAVSGWLRLVAFLYLAAVSIALALIDLDVHRLPNAIVLPSFVVGVVLLVPAALLAGEPLRLLQAAIGAAALFALYLVMALVKPGGMGFGDVKLAAVLGLFLGFLGWAPLVVGAFAAFLLGGLFALVLLTTRRASRTQGIPFGPWMLLGAWVGVLGGDALAGSYLSLFSAVR